MATKTLSQINQELGSIYDPYAKNIQAKQALIPEQIKSEEAGLGAKQTQAYDEILGGARRRGLGFAGIPLGEQAKYNATEYMPALARLRQSGREQSMSLEEALLNLSRDRATQARGIFDADRNYDLANRQFSESQRQFNEQMRESARARAASAASAAQGSSWMSALGGGSSGQQAKAPGANDKAAESAWHNILNVFGGQQGFSQADPNSLRSDYLATARSAQRGNKQDLIKLQLYRQARPDLFKAAYSWEKSGGKYGQVLGARY